MYRHLGYKVTALLLLFAACAVWAPTMCRSDEPRIIGDPFVMMEDVTPGTIVMPQKTIDVAAGDGQFAAVWIDTRHVRYNYFSMGMREWANPLYFARFQADGAVLDPVGIRVSSGPYNEWPAVAWNGENYLVVWNSKLHHDHTERYQDIYACRVSPEGALLDGLNGFLVAGEKGNETRPTVASDGVDWYVVWQRMNLAETETRIYGTKITADGQVVNLGGVRLCSNESQQMSPSIAWRQGGYVVAFQDERNEPGGGDIYATRVLADGTIQDPNGIPVCNAPGYQGEASVAALADGMALIAWEDSRNLGTASDIYTARLNQMGSVLDPNGFAVCAASEDQRYPDVSGGSDKWVVTWQDHRVTPYAAYLAEVGSDGTVLPPGGAPLNNRGTYQKRPRAASDGDDIVVAWADAPVDNEGGTDVMAQALDLGGPVPPAPFAVSTAAPYQRSIALTYTGSGFLAAYEMCGGDPYNPDIYIAPLDDAGKPTSAGEILLKGGPEWDVLPAVAFDGTNALVVWVNQANDLGDILAARVAPNGTVLDNAPIPVCTHAEGQLPISVAYGGGVYLIVWEDRRAEKLRIYGMRMTPEGVLLDPPNGFLVCASPAENAASRPRLEWNGASFLAVWRNSEGEAPDPVLTRITGRFIFPDPQVLTQPFVVYDGSSDVSVQNAGVDWSGTNHLVAWEHWPLPSGSPPQLRFRRVSAEGVVLDPAPVTIATDGLNTFPSVVWNGDLRTVLWTGIRDEQYNNYLARVLDSGEVLDPQGIPVFEANADRCGRLPFAPVQCAAGDGRVLICDSKHVYESPYGIHRIVATWFTPPLVAQGISDARALPENTLVTVPGVKTTAGNTDLSEVFYIEESSRACGMRILWADSEVPRSVKTTVSGLVQTVQGERVIKAQAVSLAGASGPPIEPLGMMNKSVGGASPCPLVPEVGDSNGCYNVGLLIRVWGAVTAVGDDWFYIDDGSNLNDGSGNVGVKVTLAGAIAPSLLLLPDEGDYVIITGLSSCEKPEDDVLRLVRIRDANDMTIVHGLKP